jgi:large subunit ribosomal protein L29
MKADDLRVLDVEELLTRLKSSRRELYELRFKLAVGQLDDHRQIRKVRQDIAQILTFKRMRELGLVQDVETEAPAQAEPVVAVAPAAAKRAGRKAGTAPVESAEPAVGEAEEKE